MLLNGCFCFQIQIATVSFSIVITLQLYFASVFNFYYQGYTLSFLKYILLFIFFISSYFLISLPAFSSQQSNELPNTSVNKRYGNQLKFSQFSAIDGLSSSTIFDINQDKQGYIWIATEDGLNRFDGKNFRTYRHDINKENSISDNVIRKIFIDTNNTLWVGTQNGLSRYNRNLDNFDNYYQDENDDDSLNDNVIWDIYQDNTNLLWVSTDTGLHTLTLTINGKAKPRFHSVNITDFTGVLSEVKTIYQDKNKYYWFGSYDNGIHLADENLSYIGSLQAENKVDLHINANTLFDLKEIDGQLWLATDNGLFIVNPLSKNQYQLDSHINAQSRLQHGLTTTKKLKAKQTLLSNHVRAITQYNGNNVWLATDKGLNVINLLDDKISSHQNNSNNTSLSENWLMTIFKDNNDTLWLGSYGGGLNKYSPLSAKLYHGLAEVDIKSKQHFRVESFTQTNDGTIYLSTEQQGVFSLKDGIIKSIKLGSLTSVRQVLADKENNLWIITRDGELFNYIPLSRQLIRHNEWLENSNYATDRFIIFIDNSLWYINKLGLLSRYKIKENNFTTYQNKADHFIRMQKDKNNTLWLVSDEKHLLTFNTKDYSFNNQKINISKNFNNSQITNIAVSREYIWLTSNSQGINLINKVTKESTTFHEKNGLKITILPRY